MNHAPLYSAELSETIHALRIDADDLFAVMAYAGRAMQDYRNICAARKARMLALADTTLFGDGRGVE